jgi:predicted DNA-binding transcriptional regulator AlpA
MRSRDELAKILKDEVLDIWQVADLTGMKRTSIHTYLIRPKSDFPRPVWESSPTDASGSQKRHPTRLWSRAEVENWVSRKRPETGTP